MNFAQKAKEWRQSQGYTQWALADKLDIYPQTISGVENGKICPGHVVIKYLENGMGAWLYGKSKDTDG